MFEPVVRDESGRVVDPRDVPPSRRMSLFCASQLDRFTSVLSANVEALEPDNQLELGAHLSSCVATMEWMKCRVASSLALKDAKEPLATATTSCDRGKPVMRQLGGDGTPKVSEYLIPELALAIGCSEREATAYIGVGMDLRFRLRCTNAEFGGGRISYAAAKAISEETRALSDEAVERLDAVLAEAALQRAPARLRLLARREAAAADPSAAERRHREAVAKRSASMFSLGDGIGHPHGSTAAAPSTVTDWLPARTELRVTMSADTLLGI
jgi:hypothetical protein